MKFTRRTLLCAVAAVMLPVPAISLTEADARELVRVVVDEINAIIASGKSEAAMIQDFERLFVQNADLPVIARSTLGSSGRVASPEALKSYQDALVGYISRKYGKQFRSFAGTTIEVKNVLERGRFYEVNSVVYVRGKTPLRIAFRVSDRAGRIRFFDMLVEGISLISVERTEIGAVLDRFGGDIDLVIEWLHQNS